MDNLEYLKIVKNHSVDNVRIEEVNKKFECTCNELLSKAISCANEVDFFGEERRALSYKEILDFKEYFDVEPKEYGFVPLIDAYDGTFIGYAIAEDKWAKFNVYDKVLFKKKESLDEVL